MSGSQGPYTKSPERVWAYYAKSDQEAILGKWNSLMLSLEEGDSVEAIRTRLSRLLKVIKVSLGLNEPLSLMIYAIMVVDPPQERTIKDKIELALIDIIAVISLYGECKVEQRFNAKKVGVSGEARTLWEVDNNLNSAAARWHFAQKKMVEYELVTPNRNK